jgi:hypothetical protein
LNSASTDLSGGPGSHTHRQERLIGCGAGQQGLLA